jgi:hypothetical protein
MHVIGLLVGSCMWLLEWCSVLACSKRASAFWFWARRNTTERERGTEHRKGQSKGVVVLLRHTSTMDEDDCWSSASGRLAQHLGMASRQSWRTGDVRGAAQRAAAALQRNGTRQAVGDGLVDVAPGEAGKAGGDGRSDVGDAGDSARGSTTWPGAASNHVPHAPLMLVLWYIAVRGVPACCRLLAHYLLALLCSIY